MRAPVLVGAGGILEVPQDRAGTFEPMLVKKRRLGGTEGEKQQDRTAATAGSSSPRRPDGLSPRPTSPAASLTGPGSAASGSTTSATRRRSTSWNYGVELVVIKELLGHAQIGVYAHVRIRLKRDVIEIPGNAPATLPKSPTDPATAPNRPFAPRPSAAIALNYCRQTPKSAAADPTGSISDGAGLLTPEDARQGPKKSSSEVRTIRPTHPIEPIDTVARATTRQYSTNSMASTHEPEMHYFPEKRTIISQ